MSWPPSAGVRGLHLGSGSAMKLCSTRLGYLWLEAARSGLQQAKGEPSDEEGVNSAPHDRFPKLQGVSSIRSHHTAEGEDARSEWSVRAFRRRFSRATALRCFPTSLAVLSAAESSSVATRGRVAVWESCDAKETMAMSMSSLESPLGADPVILMSFLRCVPVIKGSR
jgi:hypothetical protein